MWSPWSWLTPNSLSCCRTRGGRRWHRPRNRAGTRGGTHRAAAARRAAPPTWRHQSHVRDSDIAPSTGTRFMSLSAGNNRRCRDRGGGRPRRNRTCSGRCRGSRSTSRRRHRDTNVPLWCWFHTTSGWLRHREIRCGSWISTSSWRSTGMYMPPHAGACPPRRAAVPRAPTAAARHGEQHVIGVGRVHADRMDARQVETTAEPVSGTPGCSRATRSTTTSRRGRWSGTRRRESCRATAHRVGTRDRARASRSIPCSTAPCCVLFGSMSSASSGLGGYAGVATSVNETPPSSLRCSFAPK